MYDLVSLGRAARAAARVLRTTSTAQRNAALFAAARALRDNREKILEANRTDVELARCAGCRAAPLARLALTAARIEAFAARVEAVCACPDPIGAITGGTLLPNGMELCTVCVPIGVIALISDAAPAASVDTVSLCIKSGNVCMLSGGRSAFATTRAIAEVLRQAVAEAGLTPDSILLVEDTSEETTRRLLAFREGIDLIIPYGDIGFLKDLRDGARVPILNTAGGCSCLYIDRAADLTQAVRIADNARTAAPTDPISIDTVLVHSEIAERFLPALADALDLHAVELRGCARTRRILPDISPARESDWGLDYRGMTLNLRVVDSIEEAIEFLERYSDHTADGIVTQDIVAARRFAALADAAAICVNASPRKIATAPADPGVSVGFSHSKLHVRGPIGLQAFTTAKTLLIGNGQI